jgi:hypothetical protein
MELDLTKQLLFIQTEALRILEQNLGLFRMFGASGDAIRESQERHDLLLEIHERTWENIQHVPVTA